MNKHLTTTLAAGAAVLGLAAPALAQTSLPLPSDAKFDVPAGKIEHTVRIDQVSGPKAIPSHTKTVQWLMADRSHTIVTDVTTGRVKAETVATRNEIRTYNADDKVIRVERRKRAGGLPATSFTFEAAVQRAYIEQGYVRVIGERQVDGRRALVTEHVAGGTWRSDPADTRTVAVVDAETHTLLERTTTHPSGDFTHAQQFPVNRVIDAAPENVRATMTMKPRRNVRVVRRAAKARAAAATSAVPTASDPVALVPEGQVEHTVTVSRIAGTRAVPSHERTERWLTRTRSRVVVTDVKTGRLRTEITTTPTETRIYDAARDRVTIRRTKRAQKPPYNAAAFEAAVQKAYLDEGITRVVEEKVVDGRRVLVVESVPGRWRTSEMGSRTVATIDAETFAVLERVTALPSGEYSQTETYEVTELLPAASKLVTMRRHAGAKVARR